MIHPIVDTEQPVGRIIRLLEGKKPAKALVFLDSCPSYLGMYMKSHKFVSLNATLRPHIKVGDLERIL